MINIATASKDETVRYLAVHGMEYTRRMAIDFEPFLYYSDWFGRRMLIDRITAKGWIFHCNSQLTRDGISDYKVCFSNVDFATFYSISGDFCEAASHALAKALLAIEIDGSPHMVHRILPPVGHRTFAHYTIDESASDTDKRSAREHRLDEIQRKRCEHIGKKYEPGTWKI